MAFVYMLWSTKDGGWYIGKTSRDIRERFIEHCAGFVKATRARWPLHLAYLEEVQNGREQKREYFLKHPKGYSEKLQITQQLLRRRNE